MKATTYDALGRKASSNDVEGNSLIYSYGFGYDAGGNLTLQSEYKAGLLIRSVGMSYYSNDRLQTETVHAGANTSAEQTTSTTYTYDAIGNRTQKAVVGGLTTTYTYSNDELAGWSDTGGNSVSYTYDGNGNRATRVQAGVTYNYGYDTENRLISLTQAGVTYGYLYDYRNRRVNRTEGGVLTQVIFSGGNSVQEYTGSGTTPTVEFVRGSDWGGGVGGILYSLRSGATSYDHFDGRGDMATQTSGNGTVTFQGNYEAWGNITDQFGTSQDRQRANTKEADPTGLLDEGMRFRDLETGVFLTRDPAGFVDGPNLYGYVHQNPWTKFDPEGLQGVEAPEEGDELDPEAETSRAMSPLTPLEEENNREQGQVELRLKQQQAQAKAREDENAQRYPGLPPHLREIARRIDDDRDAAEDTNGKVKGKSSTQGGAPEGKTAEETQSPQDRGRESERRVLNDTGNAKNTETYSTSVGDTIPDFVNDKEVGDVKDTKTLSNTKQMRAQREVAQLADKDHVVYTGQNTKVSKPMQSSGTTVVPREDLGPQSNNNPSN